METVQERANILYAARENGKQWVKDLTWIIIGMKDITGKPEVQFAKIFLTDDGTRLQRSLTNLQNELTKAIISAHEFRRKKEKHERKKGLDSIKAQVHDLTKKKKVRD